LCAAGTRVDVVTCAAVRLTFSLIVAISEYMKAARCPPRTPPGEEP
jgi:hypothetical protein